jgi:hypothetical protein
MRRGLGCLVVLVFAGLFASASSARVLRVGAYHGVHGTYTSIQAAVSAAHRGDWILVGPGDYKERADHRVNRGPQPSSTPAGVVITKANLRLRGMNRNTVIVDGTKPGSAACSTKNSAQDFGPAGAAGQPPLGRNGILIWKAWNVTVQNLTVCNFLGGSGDVGNEIWWNGGDGSAKVGGYGFFGSYLSATSSFFKDENTAAKYGIFSSNWSGGTWDRTYASNFNDSGYYIGACQQICNQTMTRAHGQYNALGYSGSNSGGRLLVKNSEFDHNKDGFDTNSQNGDNPPPQNGACPAGVKPPIAGAPTCWVFTQNYVHDNNNPDVPFAGTAGAGPVGTGMSLSGARNDTVMNNRFVRNNAWGVIVVPFTDSGPPCTGGTLNSPLLGQGSCLFDEWGVHVINNSFTANGAYGNPTNGQFDQLNLEAHPSSCFSGNTDTHGALSADAASLQVKYPTCTTASVPPNINVPFLNEVLCDSQVSLAPFGCAPTDHYPRRTFVAMPRLTRQATMPNPCQGVPVNPWCPRKRH